MRGQLARLLAELRSDRIALTAHLATLEGLELGATEDEGMLSRAAWALHHAYTAVETILERCARTLEDGVPEGGSWHRELLDTARLELPGVRPPLLSDGTVTQLHDLRAFRHFVRHGYAVRLDVRRLLDLQETAGSLRPDLDADLDQVDAWLVTLLEAASR